MFQNPAPFSTVFQTDPHLAAVVPPPTQDTLIIHHLSDLHRGRIEGGRHALAAYGHRLYHLPPEKQPHLLIITGDLTLSGTRDELHEAADAIRNMTMRWDDMTRRQRVFVVPGPHDIDWSNTSDKTSAFEMFHQEFHSFCTPLLSGRDGKFISGSEPFCYSSSHHFLVYTFNTCYTPDNLPHPLPKPTEELVKQYRSLWKERAKAQSRLLGGSNEASRTLFLESTEDLIAKDTGMVHTADITSFSNSIKTLHLDEPPYAVSYPGDESTNPLKILVTHHPLIAFAGRKRRTFDAAEGAGDLLRAARSVGMHVVLHGHTHEPHVLSDLPIESISTGQELPILQIGAGSLGGSGREAPTYNEIVATRSRASGRWSLDLSPINLNAEAERTPFRFTFLPPVGEANSMQPTRPNENPTTMRVEFERRMRIALRLLAEEVETEYQTEIPVRPLETIKDTIKEVIFAGIETRVGLALKQRHQDGNLVLHNRYIVPDVQFDDQYIHPFPYPDTIAAWALIQGEPLIYPAVIKDQVSLVSYEWLRRSDKYDAIKRHLSDMAQRGNVRANDLLTKFVGERLRIADMYQPSPKIGQPTRFGSFISMPVPLRYNAAAAPRLREIGVLNVDIVDPDPQQPGAAFTEERIDMLRTASTLIDLVLTTADKLRRPQGRWVVI